MQLLKAFGSLCGHHRAALCTQAAAAAKVNKTDLMKLRKATGYSFVNCKRALVQFGSDLKAAERWLHEVAQKEGWQKAVGLAEKSARQGLIGVVADGPIGALVEVNCQTDFVSSSERFRTLSARMASTVLTLTRDAVANDLEFGNALTASINIDTEHVLAQSDGSGLLNEALAFETGKLGEKLALTRAAALIAKPEPHTAVFAYAHPRGILERNVQLGQFGTLVALRGTADTPDLAQIGQHICLHVVGMKPKSIGTAPAAQQQQPVVDEQLSEESQDSDDDEEVETTVINEDETELLKQQFIMQPDMSVHEYLQGMHVQCTHFMRAQRGDALE